MAECCSVSFPADLGRISYARQVVTDWCRPALDPDGVADLVLASCEAITNAIVHGSPKGYENVVTLHLWRNGEAVRVAVEDEGEGFDPDSVPRPAILRGLEPEGGGYGCHLMRVLGEARWLRGGTRVHLSRQRRCGDRVARPVAAHALA